MIVEFEQSDFGRFYIEYKGPAGHVRFTYLLGDNAYMGEQHLNGTVHEKRGNRVIIQETPDHKKVVDNFRASMRKLERTTLLEGLPNCNEPLIIYQQKPSVDK